MCTKMNGFKFDFSKIFWGGAHRAPSPDPSPAFSRASPSVRASPSIPGRFAPSTRASPSILGRFAPSIRASPSTLDWGPWFGPPKINSWIRPCPPRPAGVTRHINSPTVENTLLSPCLSNSNCKRSIESSENSTHYYYICYL